MKALLRLCGYECRRILRNKIILVFLLLFPFLMALIFNSIVAAESFSIALQNDLPTAGNDLISSFLPEEEYAWSRTPVDTEEEGLELLRKGEVTFFIHLYEEDGIPRATVHYYEYNYATGLAVTMISEHVHTEAYRGVIDMLSQYGIRLNEAYFSPCTFEAEDTVQLSPGQRTLPVQLSILVSMVILFGLAFSMARDNEIGVARQAAYTPIGIHTYQLSKGIPYLVLGLFNLAVIFCTGHFLFGFRFAAPLGKLFLLCALLIPATTSLGLLFCRIKSQMAVALCEFAVMVAPMIATMLNATDSFPLYLRWIFYLCPITPFFRLYETLAYTGVLDSASVWLLVAQAIFYYIVASLILRAETGKFPTSRKKSEKNISINQ